MAKRKTRKVNTKVTKRKANRHKNKTIKRHLKGGNPLLITGSILGSLAFLTLSGITVKLLRKTQVDNTDTTAPDESSPKSSSGTYSYRHDNDCSSTDKDNFIKRMNSISKYIESVHNSINRNANDKLLVNYYETYFHTQRHKFSKLYREHEKCKAIYDSEKHIKKTIDSIRKREQEFLGKIKDFILNGGRLPDGIDAPPLDGIDDSPPDGIDDANDTPITI